MERRERMQSAPVGLAHPAFGLALQRVHKALRWVQGQGQLTRASSDSCSPQSALPPLQLPQPQPLAAAGPAYQLPPWQAHLHGAVWAVLANHGGVS